MLVLGSLHIVCKHNYLCLVRSNLSVKHCLKNHLRSHMGLLQRWNSSQVCVQASLTAVHTQDMSTMESFSTDEAAWSLQAMQCFEDHRVAQIQLRKGEMIAHDLSAKWCPLLLDAFGSCKRESPFRHEQLLHHYTSYGTWHQVHMELCEFCAKLGEHGRNWQKISCWLEQSEDTLPADAAQHWYPALLGTSLHLYRCFECQRFVLSKLPRHWSTVHFLLGMPGYWQTLKEICRLNYLIVRQRGWSVYGHSNIHCNACLASTWHAFMEARWWLPQLVLHEFEYNPREWFSKKPSSSILQISLKDSTSRIKQIDSNTAARQSFLISKVWLSEYFHVIIKMINSPPAKTRQS